MKWISAMRYVEILEGWIIDTGAGYTVIRKTDGKSATFPPYIGVFEDVLEFLKNEKEA